MSKAFLGTYFTHSWVYRGLTLIGVSALRLPLAHFPIASIFALVMFDQIVNHYLSSVPQSINHVLFYGEPTLGRFGVYLDLSA